MYKSKKILALIPARKGSKSIINKNLSYVGSNSLLEIAVKFVKKNRYIDYSIISSDSSKYINLAKKYGINDYIKRKKKLSSDIAIINDVILDTLENLNKKNLKFDILLLIEPTSPLRNNQDVLDSLKKIVCKKAYSAFTVSKVDSKFNPKKILKIKNEKIYYNSKSGKHIQNKQELKDSFFFKNGLIYAIDISQFMKKKLIISSNSYPIITKRYIANIDSVFDLKLANFLLKNEK